MEGGKCVGLYRDENGVVLLVHKDLSRLQFICRELIGRSIRSDSGHILDFILILDHLNFFVIESFLEFFSFLLD